MINTDNSLRPALVRLGTTLGVKRYPGQHPTDAAHEFADAAMAVIKILDYRWGASAHDRP
jgi:hypothetical protein